MSEEFPLRVVPGVQVYEHEVQLSAIRAQGAGGQNVNKVATAIHLRFDIHGSSLPEAIKTRLLGRKDQRISDDGVLIIKAQAFRSQDKNRSDALDRLQAVIRAAAHRPRPRKPTRPSRAARQRRMDNKARKGKTKALRGKVKTE